MKMMRKKLLCGSVLATALLFGFGLVEVGYAEEKPVSKPINIFSMSLDELSQIEVISSSRQSQKLNTTSVPITVVTQDDIHYSGATNIYELLQFSPSIDMLRVDRNRYAMGVRGLHDVYSDRTLVLINGRTAENPLFGGSEFMRQPLLMEDIERIEIVRGPGGAAWGANAFNGVINVITKKPEDCLGLLLSTQWNTFGDNYEQFRWAAQEKQWSWRISGGWNQQESTSDALDETYTSSIWGNYKTRDFSRNSIVDTEFINHLSKDTELSFGLGWSNRDIGSFPMLLSFRKTSSYEETIRSFAKLQTQLDDESSAYIQWTGNFADTKWPSTIKYSSMENDVEAQLTFSPVENHTASVGGNVRFTSLNQDMMYSDDIALTEDPLRDTTGGLFVIDRWQATDSLAFEGQFRQDYSDLTGRDWSTRLAAIIDLNKDIEEYLRFAFARAYRAPKAGLSRTNVQRMQVFPGVYAVTLRSNEDLDNEGLQSYEIGYGRSLARNVRFSANVYQQEYSDLVGYDTRNGVIPGVTTTTMASNIAGAEAWGAETEIEWYGDKGSLSVWYTLNKFQDDGKLVGINTEQLTRSYAPAEHKAGLTGRLFLAEEFVLNANYRYTSSTSGSNGPCSDVSKSNVVDLTLSKAFKMNKATGELLVGVSDIFNETERVVTPVGLLYYPSETPGRIFFARLQMKF